MLPTLLLQLEAGRLTKKQVTDELNGLACSLDNIKGTPAVELTPQVI